MSQEYENCILAAFEGLDVNNFRVHLDFRHIFVCGGEIDPKKPCPPSLRDRFVSFSSGQYVDIHDSIVLAERFKDYFKENAYPDLFVFESEIASISSLVMIFLESPGSLVELGMFCAVDDLYKKMIIVAPREEVEAADSFIYLGPLENLKRKDERAVLVYPWPSDKKIDYDKDHLIDICEAVKEKWSRIPRTVKFNEKEPGHVAFLVAEVIRIGFPIIITEIEYALLALGLDISPSKINRLIYLLEKTGIICIYEYGGYKYFYYNLKDEPVVSFHAGKKFDIGSIRMNLRQVYLMKEDGASRKRRSALKGIASLLGDRR